MTKACLILALTATLAHADDLTGSWSTECTTLPTRTDSAIFRENFAQGQWADIMDYFEDPYCQDFQGRSETLSTYTTKPLNGDVRALDFVDAGGNHRYTAYRIDRTQGAEQLYLASSSSEDESNRPTEANSGPLVRVPGAQAKSAHPPRK